MVAFTDVDESMQLNNGLKESSPSPSLRKLKVLMLHGYTQSGPLFHAKTRALEKLLHKHFPQRSNSHHVNHIPDYPGGIQLIYPTAPILLTTPDMPGYSPDSVTDKKLNDLWAWWKRDMDSSLYVGLEQSLATIARVISDNNGIDGIMGFSQGAAAAAIVTSLLEPERIMAFEELQRINADVFPYPQEWIGLKTLCPDGLKFAVAYSGFLPSHPVYEAFFEPKIQTPIMHFIGSYDTVLDEKRSKALVDRCAENARKLIYHPGGHFVPCDKKMSNVVISFIIECLAHG
ncbi:Dihydrofolate reductase [Golovinomyces cichoracearum]|uniref:Dihydrofolate reductase n=1 Tax=Golovinomyces cichoracearum TaxID=62708 RepID=A0A420IWT1_9PEZI|nr:Dihydrofolate reductase [Golovinomyces cichoracearum]